MRTESTRIVTLQAAGHKEFRTKHAPFGSSSGDTNGDQFPQSAASIRERMVTRPSTLTWLALGLLALIWASTALLQVPAHRRLNEAYDPGTIRRAFYDLFLDLYDTDIPPEYVRDEYEQRWQRHYASKLDACVGFIRRLRVEMA